MSTEGTQAHTGRPVTVIEIGSDWLKMLQGSLSKGQLVIAHVHLEKFDSATSLLARSITDALKQDGFSSAPVISCLPRQMVTVRNLELPSTDPDEIADMIDFQAAKQTPYAKEEIFTDYRIVGSEREGYSRVMLAIVQRSVLRHRFHILEESGMDAERMSISSEGILNWLKVSGAIRSGEALALIDVDSFYSDFMVVEAGRLMFSRSMLIGTNDLQDDADPEKMRHRFVQEAQRSLELYQAEGAGGKAPERLLLTGAGPRVPGLLEELGPGTGLPAEAMDPMQQTRPAGKSAPASEEHLRYVSMTALIGMAMTPETLEINLIPASVRLRKGLIEKARRLSMFGSLVMTVLVFASLFALVRFNLKRQDLAALQAQVEQLEPVALRVQRMYDLLEVAHEYQNERLAAVNILAAIHPLIPPEISLESTEVDIDRSSMMLSGTGASLRDVRTLVGKLDGVAWLKAVKEDGSTAKDPRTGRFKFKVVATLEKSR